MTTETDLVADADWPQEARNRVTRGALLLDEARPGWADSIDLATLDLADTDSCILAQLYGQYFEGARALELDDYSDEDGHINHGFDLRYDDSDARYVELHAAWVQAVEARR